MKKVYTWIVNHPGFIFTLYAFVFIVCVVFWRMVDVNYDINDYLPADSASTLAIEAMEDEFGGGIPNARVMVKNVSIAEALEYKQKLSSVDGVTGVIWLDDQTDIHQPVEVMDENTLDTYYVDGNAVFSVTVAEEKTVEAVNAMRDIIGEDNCMSGRAVSTAAATESTVDEITVIAICSIAFAFFILVLTTSSWIEPAIILGGLGVAVVVNAGTNIIFGEISFVTNAAGSILQLAVSLDYSVFLLHRFEEYRRTTDNAKEAMVNALESSASSILSSGLTTVIGFLALCLMRFRIGPDLGLALSKGVALSLIAVFTFMPVFILASYKVIEKTHHRPFVPSFSGFSKVVCKIMIPMMCIFAVFVVPSFLASNANAYYYGGEHIFGTDTKFGSDAAEIEEVFGKNDTYVLMVPVGDRTTEAELSAELHTYDRLTSILSYVDTVGASIPTDYLEPATLAKLESDNYTRFVMTADVDLESDTAFGLIEEIRETAQKYYPDKWYLAGGGVSTLDLKDTVTEDMLKVNLIAIAAVFVVLLLSMKSLTLPVLLVLGIETAIWINLAIPYFTDNVIFYIAYLIISTIQLGATVDYAILFTDRYIENRGTMGKIQAIRKVITDCSVSVMTSASVLCVVGFLMGIISTHGLLAQLGMFLGKGTLLSLAIVLFVLPGMLTVFDKVIQKTTIGLRLYREENKK